MVICLTSSHSERYPLLMEASLDNITLKKKLSAYVSDGGYLKGVSDEVLYDVLVAWENWTGSAKEFYRSLGFSQKQMASLIGKAKKLKRDGYFGEGDFKAIKLETTTDNAGVATARPCAAAEIIWTNGQVIRFSDVAVLVDFLKKSA